MHFDKTELAQISLTGLARHDIYRKIHKALRMAMADIMVRVGHLDPQDTEAVEATCLRMLEFVNLCEHHLEKENAFIHPVLESKAAGASARIANEHHQHMSDFARLRELTRELSDAPALARTHVAHELYHELALFVAHNLVHMYIEETANNGVLWKYCTDGEILALEQELVASISPDAMQGVLRWMLPAISHDERCAIFAGMKQSAPKPVLDANLRLAFEALPLSEWNKLTQALDDPSGAWLSMA
ncbi:hemerythrin domain-containing protein [Chitinilyticum litopenaei]|uniref:hemerythrin domain-containing protein n=1 Tax=Chitinilyticum litopenaei TaxID=1121276 RepID=UPI00048CB71F|nr:hypothetical protein [Chitinilyticum litopenaei]